MTRFTHFSRHALKRIDQRTKLNYFSIADILDHGGAVDVGAEPVFDRRHWLFYSAVDQSYFVAVQDSVTGLVVTILPLDYHQNLAWTVSEIFLEEAKSKACTVAKPQIIGEKTHPSKIIVKARYICDEGRAKTTTLTKFESSDYGGDLFRVLQDKSFNSEIVYQCNCKGIDASRVYEILIALGNDGEPLLIDWKIEIPQ